MYTRSYFTDDKTVDIPENYDGTAFGGGITDTSEGDAEKRGSLSDEERTEGEKAAPTGNRIGISQFFEKLPLKSIFPIKDLGSYFTGHKLIPEKIGMEEALILAIALYLFFSKDGDKECAIMLLLLIFIN